MRSRDQRASFRVRDRHPEKRRPSRRPAIACCALVAALLAAAGAAASRSQASPEVSGHLGVCFYVTDNDSAATENIEVAAPGKAGAKGKLTFKGLGLNQSVSFKLNGRGVGLSSFPVSESGSAVVTVTLLTRPPRTRTLRITLQSASGLAQQNGCVPR